MKEGTRICRVCGKEYEYCHTNSINTFRWQDVACSVECGAIYFKKIEESRKKASETVKPVIEEEPAETIPVIEEVVEFKRKSHKRKKTSDIPDNFDFSYNQEE